MLHSLTHCAPTRGAFRSARGRFATIALCTLALALGGRAHAQADIAEIWNDPVFQKQFVGAYGVNAEIEPRYSPEDVKILDRIRPAMADDLPHAETMLKKSMKSDSSAVLDFTLATIQAQQGRMVEATESYRRAVEKFPSFRRAWRQLGLVYGREGKHEESIRAFTKMIELGGGDGSSYGFLGLAYAAKQDYQAAEGAFRNALLLQPDNSEWRYRLTLCALRQEKYEDAAALLDDLIEGSPEKSEYWLLQAETYLGMKQMLKAAENLEIMDFLGRGTVDTSYMLAEIYVRENLMDAAARAYVRALDVDPNQPLTRPLRSIEYLLAQGAASHARQLVSHVRGVSTVPLEEADRRKLLKLEARINMAEGAGSAETIAVLEEIVTLDPLDGDALLLLGDQYASQDEPDRAIFYYERAAKLDAFEAKAKMYHARVLVRLGRYSDAVPLLRRAHDLKPREDLARHLETVERLARSRRQ